MRKKHTLPVIAGLLTVSAALIAGLASADMKSDRTKKSMMYAKNSTPMPMAPSASMN
jgi:hypothetical protein